jgi:hypothetical protein
MDNLFANYTTEIVAIGSINLNVPRRGTSKPAGLWAVSFLAA